MTDTARTLAAIKALLADNTSRDISPQDMRDVVESIANPIGASGFGPSVGNDEAALSLLGSHSISTTWDWIPLQVRTDPNGWVVPDSYTATHPAAVPTVPANSSLLLPRGIYTIGLDARIASAPSAGEWFQIEVDWVDQPVGDVVYDDPGYFYPPAHGMQDYVPGGDGSPSAEVSTHGIFRVTQEMEDAGIRVGVVAQTTHATPIAFVFADVFVLKIA